jgi:hypothetical protein
MGQAKARGTYADRKAAPRGKQMNHHKTLADLRWTQYLRLMGRLTDIQASVTR